jgi:hypothetical protein
MFNTLNILVTPKTGETHTWWDNLISTYGGIPPSSYFRSMNCTLCIGTDGWMIGFDSEEDRTLFLLVWS